MAKASPLKGLFNTMKETGIVKELDQWLLLSYSDDPARRNDVNSPSQALGCPRANYYKRTGVPSETPSPRLRRIFENGHKVHQRLQKYLKRMNKLLIEEAPLFDLDYNIQGHCDGVVRLNPVEIALIEIKSINNEQFKELIKQGKPKIDHIAQGSIYINCLEKHQKKLKEKYKNKGKFKLSSKSRAKFYASLYAHLTDDPFEWGKTKEEKIDLKVKEHLKLDDILYNANSIKKVIYLYENKNNQELKEFIISKDEKLLEEALELYNQCNKCVKKGNPPEKTCKNKSQASNCGFRFKCFPN